MKLFLFLFVATVLMVLAAYDYYSIKHANQMVQDINTVSRDISVRGQQQIFIYQKFLGKQMILPENSTDTDTTLAITVLEHSALKFDSKAALRWDSLDKLDQLQQNIAHSVERHYSIFSDNDDNEVRIVNDSFGSEELVADISELQNLYVLLNDFISEELNNRLVKAAAINTVSVLGILLLISATLARDNIKAIKDKEERIRLFEYRRAETMQSRKMQISIMEDLSHEKNMAEQLTHLLEDSNKSILRQNQEMEQFIYTVSHDLKAPLVSISGFSSILSKELETELSDKQLHYLNRIRGNVTDMGSMLGDLLEMSRVAKQELVREHINIDEHIQPIVSLFENQLQTIGGTIAIKGPLGRIYANERLIGQCVSNLIANAINYRSSDRPLSIEIISMQDNVYKTISVKDNGIGIEEKHHDRVFRLFEHLDSGKGTGVGLTIVKTIVDKHGGHVRLDSQLNKGSTFHLNFPISEETRQVA